MLKILSTAFQNKMSKLAIVNGKTTVKTAKGAMDVVGSSCIRKLAPRYF